MRRRSSGRRCWTRCGTLRHTTRYSCEMTAAAIYARISDDSDGTGLGVDRQVKDCTALVIRRGWTITGTYVDNDVSATMGGRGGRLTRGGKRREYERMIRAIKAGTITAVAVWDVDRLSRAPRELEDWIDLADQHGLQLASVGGEIDLATEQGRMMARMKGVVGRYETEQTKRRVTRKIAEMAEAGIPHGPVRYGWRRVIDHDGNGRRSGFHDELHPAQAAIVRECATRVLAGESLRQIALDLNRRGERTMRGDTWRSVNVSRLLQRPCNAGLRVHQGRVIGPSLAPAILDRDTWDRVCALLSDPDRRTTEFGGQRRHLLSGLARCGADGCNGTMGVTKAANGRTMYQCRVCWSVSRSQVPLDDLVERIMVARLERPDALDVLLAGDPTAVKAAREEIATVSAKLALAADQYADDEITAEQLRRINGRLRPRLRAAAAARDSALPAAIPARVVGPEAATRWHSAPLAGKRALIEALLVVTLLPAGRGARTDLDFDPSTVRIDWVG
jgi:site-specific DNA recombinase